MAISKNLQTLSLIMAWGATLGAVWEPVLLTITILFPGHYPFFGDVRADIPMLAAPFPAFYREAAFGLALIPNVFVVWAWWSLRLLFLDYAKGDVFSARTIGRINMIALALLGSAITAIIVPPLSGMVLYWSRVHHPFSFSFSFGSNNFADLFKAAIVYVVALVMADARRLADENAKFV